MAAREGCLPRGRGSTRRSGGGRLAFPPPPMAMSSGRRAGREATWGTLSGTRLSRKEKTVLPRTLASAKAGCPKGEGPGTLSTPGASRIETRAHSDRWRPQPFSRLPSSVALPQRTSRQSREVALTEVFLTTALMPSQRPWCAREMRAPSMTVPRPPRTRMPYQEPLSPWVVNSTGRARVPWTTRLPSMISSTRWGSTPEFRASSEAAMTCTPGSRVSRVPQATVTSPWRR
jgi:hypothetical protein